MRRIISFIGAALLMCSCIYEDLSDCPNYIQGIGKPVDVEFSVSCNDSTETRSSISASETQFSTGTSFSHNTSWIP